MPFFLRCFSGLSPETKSAISNATDTLNSSNGIAKIHRSTIESNVNVFNAQNPDGWNKVTKGDRGPDSYVMITNMTDMYTDFSWKGHVKEVDIDINTYYPWGNAAISTSVYDVQNCITHEIAHVLATKDLYGAGQLASTMFGYVTKGELYKRSLDTGTKNLVNSMYY